MKINIIGAGPAGSFAAYLLAKKGFDVNLFEEHSQIGQPVHCTGLVTDSFQKIIPLKKEFLVNAIKHYRLISPSQKQVIINKKEYILDRAAFDQYLVNKALNHGVNLHLNYHFVGQQDGFLLFRHKNKTKKIKVDLTIGADGPLSQVAKAFHFPNQHRFYFGFQARIKGNFDPATSQVAFGQKIAPGFFAWLVPESQTIARLGLATPYPSRFHFQQLIKPYQKQVLSLHAGLIPIYNPKIKTQFKNTYLLGDAAAQVKATTGGGLIPGLQAAQCLAQAINQNQSYPDLWKKKLGKNLQKHLLIRKIINRV